MNFFTDLTANEALKCSKADALAIFQTLDKNAPATIAPVEVVSVTHVDSQFTAEYYPKSKELYFLGEDCVDDSMIPDEFIITLGKLLSKLKKPYLEFGLANTADRHAPGSYGGSSFRITSKGTLIHPKITWPRG
jgi:hypothetical protein